MNAQTVLAGENFPRQYHPFRGFACQGFALPGRQIRRNAFLLSDGKLTFAKMLLAPYTPALRIALKGAAAPFKSPRNARLLVYLLYYCSCVSRDRMGVPC